MGKKIWKFLSSMQFAVALLVILAAACSLSSFITQGQTYEWYAAQYSERTAALILALHLDDAYHSWWFAAISAFLCLNLLLCNVIRAPQILRRMREEKDPASALRIPETAMAEGVRDPEALFRKLHMPSPAESTDENGHRVLYSVKNSIGLWGAWVCHLGILLLIAGFALGQITLENYVVYGVPGQSRKVGDTGYVVTIDDFRIGLREDDTVEQYTADITVRDVSLNGNGDAASASISVNNPAKLFGMTYYQNSTGWAAKIHVDENGEALQDEVICAGEYLAVADKPDLVIYFNAFYPDYMMVPGQGPATLSGQLNNPAYLYSVYYRGEIIGMNILMPDEELTIDEYTVTFSEPQNYTLIQVKRDRFTPLALLGGLVTMLGLFLAFYIRPSRVYAVEGENGWTVKGYCRKGGVIFREEFNAAAKACGKEEE
ncbi:MAG: cytochrome c biogenesis protein ResB [Solobacterium sp.]|nr:cytochrome c biogenesis protein ResB [Solobacterium sp.]